MQLDTSIRFYEQMKTLESQEVTIMTTQHEGGVVTTAQKLLERHVLCDRCLGRQFGWLSTNTSNEDRGHSLKLTMCMNADEQLKSGQRDLGISSIRLLSKSSSGVL